MLSLSGNIEGDVAAIVANGLSKCGHWSAYGRLTSIDARHNPEARTIYFQQRCHQGYHGLCYL